MSKAVPAPLWIAIAALGIITVLTLLSLLKGNFLVPLVAAACNIALLFGLMKGQKWAYIMTLILSFLGTAVAFGKGASAGMAVMIGDALVWVPVLLSTRFFFPNNDLRERR